MGEKKTIKVITLCSGYDSQCLALERLKENYPEEIDYELVAWSEFDPESTLPIERQPAVIAHNALFPQYADRNTGDMTKTDWSKFAGQGIDLLTYSTPCQSISKGGRQHGIENGSGTRSSIIWYTENAIDVLRPKFLLLENVRALCGKKFMPYFQEWQRIVESYGYKNYWKVMNSKDYGTPQSRDRVFMVSVLGDEKPFCFPGQFKLHTSLDEILEDDVDEKYYVAKEKSDAFIEKNRGIIEERSGVHLPDAYVNHPSGSVRKILLGHTRDSKGKVVNYHPLEVSHTVHTWIGGGWDTDMFVLPVDAEEWSKMRIRELKPSECFRLMGMCEKDIDTITHCGVSDSALYKLAGNSIVSGTGGYKIDGNGNRHYDGCLYNIFEKMFLSEGGKTETKGQLSLFGD